MWGRKSKKLFLLKAENKMKTHSSIFLVFQTFQVNLLNLGCVLFATLAGEKNDLLEYVAQRVVDALFDEFSKIDRIILTLKKPEAPIKADFNYVAVQIERERP